MLRLFNQANFEFLAQRRLAYGLTLAFVIPGLLLLGIRGLNTSIEFTGGTLVQIHVSDPAIRTADIRQALATTGIEAAEIQTFGAPDEFVVRARLDPRVEVSEETTQETGVAVRDALTGAFGEDVVRIDRVEAVGPKVGSELRERTLMALLLAFGAIFLVIWFRYEWRFSLAAVLATLHDIVATVAFAAYLNQGELPA